MLLYTVLSIFDQSKCKFDQSAGTGANIPIKQFASSVQQCSLFAAGTKLQVKVDEMTKQTLPVSESVLEELSKKKTKNLFWYLGGANVSADFRHCFSGDEGKVFC